jgi:flagellar hook assembly protein FlgD
VVWQEEIAPGVYQIAKRNKGPLGWGEKHVISYPDEKNADFPVVAANGQYVYSKNTTGSDYDVFWHGEYENGWTHYERNITYASGGISKYPSVAFSQVWPESKLHILWTEVLPDAKAIKPRVNVKIYTQPVEPVPYFYADLGTEEAMAYTLQKEVTLCYGQTPDLTVDYHPSKLKYSFTGLDPARYYMLKAVYYHESKDRIQQKMKVDGQQFDVANLKPKEKAEFKRWLMPNLYSDGQIEITIDKQKGEYAVCAVLSIEEYEKDCDETKGGGTQTTESKPITATFSYALMQNTPNPCSQHTAINYQLAKQGQVSLKVYNTLGQVVKTLVNESQTPGPHSVKWNGKDDAGRQVTAGIYFYRLASGEFNSTKKMVVLR